MICTCLPTGNQHGWGVAGTYINAELRKLTEVLDVADVSVATTFDCPVLMAIADFWGSPLNSNVSSTSRYVGYGFCESPETAAIFVDNWNKYDVVVCGSTWMKDRMSEIGVKNVAVAIQGVDYDIFKPPFVKPKHSPFVVFSGGKFEYRKGQDIVIAAMSRFMGKYQDVFLIAAWANMWPDTMRSMEQSPYIKYKHFTNDWKAQIKQTLMANNVPVDRVILPDIRDNGGMVNLYHSAHVGVFPNRIEAGTNLVLCEAMASGLPCIASCETGHADVVQARILNVGYPDLDDLMYELDFLYNNREALTSNSISGSRHIRSKASWPKCAKELLDILERK